MKLIEIFGFLLFATGIVIGVFGWVRTMMYLAFDSNRRIDICIGPLLFFIGIALGFAGLNLM